MSNPYLDGMLERQIPGTVDNDIATSIRAHGLGMADLSTGWGYPGDDNPAAEFCP